MKIGVIAPISSAIRVLTDPEVLVGCHYYSRILFFHTLIIQHLSATGELVV